jgi:hypothetical protein
MYSNFLKNDAWPLKEINREPECVCIVEVVLYTV